VESRQLSSVVKQKRDLEERAQQLQWKLTAESKEKRRIERICQNQTEQIAAMESKTQMLQEQFVASLEKKDSDLDRLKRSVSKLHQCILILKDVLTRKSTKKGG